MPPIAWAALLFASSSVPGPSVPALGVPHVDKAMHAAAYAVLAYMLARAGRARTPRALVLAAVAAVVYGAVDELHQRFTPGRDADPWDVLADAVGAATGGWLWWLRASATLRCR